MKKKLKSERGASILLAMFFLAVCMMVGASVLMAAQSNAGKSRSNRQNQQVYLALSSALQLVTDELTNGSYCGRYQYKKTSTVSADTVKTAIEYTQKTGIYRYETGTAENLLGKRLVTNLDALFAAYLQKIADEEASQPQGRTTVAYKPLSESAAKNEKRTFKIVANPAQLKEFEVTVTAELQDTYDIKLTATLSKMPGEYGTDVSKFEDCALVAELTPTESTPKLQGGEVMTAATSGTLYESTPMKWKLGWIARPQEEEKI